MTAMLCAVAPAIASAEVPVQPYGTNDAGGFRNVLPAGQNGLDNAAQLAEFQLHGTAAPDFADGWYGYVSTDLRDLLAANGLATTPKGAYSRLYCGNGSLAARRQSLQGSLLAALSATPKQIYGQGPCAENPQASCFDMNRWVSASGVSVPPFPFQNRPTFQQVVELTSTVPR
jgi:hypothetical protein